MKYGEIITATMKMKSQEGKRQSEAREEVLEARKEEEKQKKERTLGTE